MPEKILLASLGDSPAVITEAIYLLGLQGTQLSRVRLFITSDDEVLKSCELLEDHLKGKLIVERIVPEAELYEDIRTTEQAVCFMQTAVHQFGKHRADGDGIYVCLAGGRKVMSALLTLAVQFYGADRLFHIWAPRNLEEKSRIELLKAAQHLDPSRFQKLLYPWLDPDLEEGDYPTLIDIPFLGLFPLLPEILTGLRGEARSIPNDIQRLLEGNGLLSPGRGRTRIGEQVLQILEHAVTLPPSRHKDCEITILPQHTFQPVITLAESLNRHFPFISNIESVDWPDVSFRDDLYCILVPVETAVPIPPTALVLRTTAETPGQITAARQTVDRFLENHSA